MSTFGLMRRPQHRQIEDLNPGQALRHDGSHYDTYRRMQATLRLACDLGDAGVKKVAPHLVRFISDNRNLRVAWDHMCRCGGRSAGPDEQQLLTIPDQSIWPWLRKLRLDLSSERYRVSEDDEFVCRIPKGPGRGERFVTIQSQEHRLAQRAALQILDPLLDPKLDSLCFGGRLRRGPHLALATAERLFVNEDRRVWVTEDLRDAFCRVPISRLLQILAMHIPDEGTVKLVQRMLAGSRTPGLRQGGALSPLLLAVYLEHVLVRKWRKLHPDVPLLLYIDDILLLCRSTDEARVARRSLAELLNGTGMELKGTEKSSVRELVSSRPAEWLGYQIRRQSEELVVQVPNKALDRLGDQLALERDTVVASPVEARLRSTWVSWLNYYAPCVDLQEAREWIYSRAKEMARNRNLPQLDFDSFVEMSRDAVERWARVRQRAALRSRVDHDEVISPEWLSA